MKKIVIVQIQLEYVVDVNDNEEASEYVENVELPTHYKEDSFEIKEIINPEHPELEPEAENIKGEI